MYKILEKTQFSEKVFKFRIEAPAMAKHAHAGQFLMVRANETGERVPFTLAGWNGDEGWVEFIFMVIGKTTEMLSTYEAGDALRDVVGPLGVPTEMDEGPCAVIGGGVGLAIAFPVAKHLVETGHEVHAIMGARTKDLLLLEDQFRELLDDEHIHITTDNPIMVDGTGMCGCCRVEVGGETKFACVDGPDFDATKVDWDDLRARQAAYRTEETESLNAYKEGSCACHS